MLATGFAEIGLPFEVAGEVGRRLDMSAADAHLEISLPRPRQKTTSVRMES